MSVTNLAARVVMLLSEERLTHPHLNPLLGTGFSLFNPRLIVTAKHVVGELSSILVSSRATKAPEVSSNIHLHPAADLAAIVVTEQFSENLEAFCSPTKHGATRIGDDVFSYGYPNFCNEKESFGRLFKGYVQRVYSFNEEHNHFEKLEVGMSVFHGQSGSPVLLDTSDGRFLNAIGVVSDTVDITSGKKGNITHYSYADCVMLSPFLPWLQTIIESID